MGDRSDKHRTYLQLLSQAAWKWIYLNGCKQWAEACRSSVIHCGPV